MTDQIIIEAEPREIVGKKVRQLRRVGIIPGTIYGKKEPVNVQMEQKALRRALRSAGTTTLIDLSFAGSSRPVLVKEIQQHVTRGDVLHVDFFELDMTSTIRLEVELLPFGESKPQQEGLGAAVMVTRQAEIEALPSALISDLQVDLSKIEEPEDTIYLSDLEIPDGVTLISDPETVVARFEFTAVEEEEEEDDLLGEYGEEGEEPEVIGRETEDDDEQDEGEDA